MADERTPPKPQQRNDSARSAFRRAVRARMKAQREARRAATAVKSRGGAATAG